MCALNGKRLDRPLQSRRPERRQRWSGDRTRVRAERRGTNHLLVDEGPPSSALCYRSNACFDPPEPRAFLKESRRSRCSTTRTLLVPFKTLFSNSEDLCATTYSPRQPTCVITRSTALRTCQNAKRREADPLQASLAISHSTPLRNPGGVDLHEELCTARWASKRSERADAAQRVAKS